MIRSGWIGAHANLVEKRQCMLVSVARTTFYANRRPVVSVELDDVLKGRIGEEYAQYLFFRKAVSWWFTCFATRSHRVNRKRMQHRAASCQEEGETDKTDEATFLEMVQNRH